MAGLYHTVYDIASAGLHRTVHVIHDIVSAILYRTSIILTTTRPHDSCDIVSAVLYCFVYGITRAVVDRTVHVAIKTLLYVL